MDNAPYYIQVDHQLKEIEAQVISQGLIEFNSSFFGAIKPVHFAVFLRDDAGKVVGGVLAWMRRSLKLLYIDTIWLPENMRSCDSRSTTENRRIAGPAPFIIWTWSLNG